MKLLFYLGHPAHFYLFKETIKNLQARQYQLFIVIKSKDVLEKLLIDSNLDYINIVPDHKKNGKIGKYVSLLNRLFSLSKIIFTYKPSKLIGSAAELAILGKLFRIPSYLFFEDDFEAVPKFAKIAGPLATYLVCPNCCSAWKWDHKKIGYNSYHELAYLHPDHFLPDATKISSIFDFRKQNFILRFAQLTAYHDVGKSGIDKVIAQQLIDLLLPFGNVFITSERPLEPQFEKYRIQIPPLDIHHALYFADMYIGDSQTMTAEAAVLGTPAIRFNDFVGELSYLEELEHVFKLTFGIKTNEPQLLFQKIKELLEIPHLKKEWEDRRINMLNKNINLAQYLISIIENKNLK
jgi:predicted glycosyltransferase